MNIIITLSALGAVAGAIITIIILARVMWLLPDTRLQLLPLTLGIGISLPFLLIVSVGRMSGLYVGPTLWVSTYGSMLFLYWFGFALPMTAWVHSNIRFQREELKEERELRRNGLKEQIRKVNA